MAQRKGYPKGHPLNPNDGFDEWLKKYSIFLPSKIQKENRKFRESKKAPEVRKNKSSFDNYYVPPLFRDEVPLVEKDVKQEYFEKWKEGKQTDEAYQKILKTFPPRPERANPKLHTLSKTVPYTSGIEYVADVIAGEDQGTPLLNYDYIGPGNPIYSGDDENLTQTDRIAKEHDIQYSVLAEKSKTEEELRQFTDKADTEGIEKFWNDSHIWDQLKHGDIPDFGSFIGAAGLLGKRTYERSFGQVYPSPDVISKFFCFSLWHLLGERVHYYHLRMKERTGRGLIMDKSVMPWSSTTSLWYDAENTLNLPLFQKPQDPNKSINRPQQPDRPGTRTIGTQTRIVTTKLEDQSKYKQTFIDLTSQFLSR